MPTVLDKTSDWLSHWILGHPIKFALVILVTGSLVSIFSGDIRRFIAIPPQRLNVWILKARLENERAKLSRLVDLREDVYGLVLFLAYRMLGLALAFSLVLPGAMMMWISYQGKVPEMMMRAVGSIGVTIGTYFFGFVCTSTLNRMIELRRPDSSSKKMARKIERLAKKLGMPTGLETIKNFQSEASATDPHH